MTNPTDEEYYRIAVVQANGWAVTWGYNLSIGRTKFIRTPEGRSYLLSNVPKEASDALAFQLRDQIQALDGGYWIEISDHAVRILSAYVELHYHEGSTALDWIKCIVDSRLLGGGE